MADNSTDPNPPLEGKINELRLNSTKTHKVTYDKSKFSETTPFFSPSSSSTTTTPTTSTSTSTNKKSDAAVVVPSNVPRHEIEPPTRCSSSHLWKLMMSFYDRKGVDSWSQGIVPHFITSNAFIGRSYANVLKGFFGDVMKAGSDTGMECDVNEPFYIIELGTGSGKFSYFMLKGEQLTSQNTTRKTIIKN